MYIITRINGIQLRSGQRAIFANLIPQPLNADGFLFEYINWATSPNEGQLLNYPPIHTHHFTSHPVRYSNLPPDLMNFQPFAASTSREIDSYGYNLEQPLAVSDYICDDMEDPLVCVYQTWPAGFGRWVSSDEIDVTQVRVDNDGPSPLNVSLELGRKYAAPSRRVLPTWTLFFKITASSATYTIPAHFGPALASRQFLMPRAGMFADCSYVHSHSGLQSELWVFGAPISTVLPPSIFNSSFDQLGGSKLVSLHAHDWNIHMINTYFMNMHAEVLLCRWWSHAQKINAHLYSRMGRYDDNCLRKCSRWNFDRGTHLTMVALIEESTVQYPMHHAFQPDTAFFYSTKAEEHFKALTAQHPTENELA